MSKRKPHALRRQVQIIIILIWPRRTSLNAMVTLKRRTVNQGGRWYLLLCVACCACMGVWLYMPSTPPPQPAPSAPPVVQPTSAPSAAPPDPVFLAAVAEAENLQKMVQQLLDKPLPTLPPPTPPPTSPPTAAVGKQTNPLRGCTAVSEHKGGTYTVIVLWELLPDPAAAYQIIAEPHPPNQVQLT